MPAILLLQTREQTCTINLLNNFYRPYFIRLQARIRQWHARRLAQLLLERGHAASKIQAAWRGYRNRALSAALQVDTSSFTIQIITDKHKLMHYNCSSGQVV